MIWAPAFDRSFDGIIIQTLRRCFFSQFNKFLIACKSQGNDLADAQSWIEQFSGENKMPQVFFSADRPVLRFKREGTDIRVQQDKYQSYQKDQECGVYIGVTLNGSVQVDQRTDEERSD